jgi:hypothetical protein
LPHFQDVTIRLIVERGVLQGRAGALYIQGDVASAKVLLPEPYLGRKHHLFCSMFNAGAWELADELSKSDVFAPKSAALMFTSEAAELHECDHMLLLLDTRTWTSGAVTTELVAHIHLAMKTGVHIVCVHESLSVVGAARFECDFGRMVSRRFNSEYSAALLHILTSVCECRCQFDDGWTPAHLERRPLNLYQDIAISLKGAEWRTPGLVAFASKLVSSAGPHTPLEFKVPLTYAPRKGPNRWSSKLQVSAFKDASKGQAAGGGFGDVVEKPVASASDVHRMEESVVMDSELPEWIGRDNPVELYTVQRAHRTLAAGASRERKMSIIHRMRSMHLPEQLSRFAGGASRVRSSHGTPSAGDNAREETSVPKPGALLKSKKIAVVLDDQGASSTSAALGALVV